MLCLFVFLVLHCITCELIWKTADVLSSLWWRCRDEWWGGKWWVSYSWLVCMASDPISTSIQWPWPDFPFFYSSKSVLLHFELDITACGLVGHRRRWCIVGWSQRSAWRTSQGLWSCQQWGRGNPALPATPATITATTLPVCPAPMQPTPTAPAVKLNTPAAHHYRATAGAFVFELTPLIIILYITKQHRILTFRCWNLQMVKMHSSQYLKKHMFNSSIQCNLLWLPALSGHAVFWLVRHCKWKKRRRSCTNDTWKD